MKTQNEIKVADLRDFRLKLVTQAADALAEEEYQLCLNYLRNLAETVGPETRKKLDELLGESMAEQEKITNQFKTFEKNLDEKFGTYSSPSFGKKPDVSTCARMFFDKSLALMIHYNLLRE